MRSNRLSDINLNAISITLMTIYVITVFIYVAIFNSLAIQIIILGVILAILVMDILKNRENLHKSKIDILFIASIFAALGSIRNPNLTTSVVAGPVIFSLGVGISFFIRSDIENYKYSIAIIKWAGIFYAVTIFISHLFPGLYDILFLSILRPVVRERLKQDISRNYFSGFTSQVAYTAGYIVNSIGVISCNWIVCKKESNRKEKLLLLLLFSALIFTQKRGHIIFMILSCIFVYIQYSDKNTRISKLKKIIYSFIIIIGISLLAVKLIDINFSSSFRIIGTLQAFVQGQDITNGRLKLYKYAWSLFKQNPLFGIGWGNFRESVIGVITVYTKMDVHNIYLQLLCETGLVGSMFILMPIISTYIYTIKITRTISENKNTVLDKWKFGVLFSLYYQTFFLLYGLSGNPIYDYNFLIMDVLAWGIIYSFMRYSKSTLKDNVH